jgi:sigma-B regulation protein RsbU (phosphoserine phosphatase)
MGFVVKLLPRSLIGRVTALYATCLLLFISSGLGLFYYYQFTQEIDDAYESVNTLADVLSPTISDSIVIGDYDTVRRTLAKAAAGTKLVSAEFIAVGNGSIRAINSIALSKTPPSWISELVRNRLLPLDRRISVGGKDYGVLRLNFSAETIALKLWSVTVVSLAGACAALVVGLLMIWFPLRRMVADLAAATDFASELSTHRGRFIEINSHVRETRQLAAALNRVSLELTAQHRALTDSELRKSAIMEAALDCFITINDAGQIVDFNAAAERTFGYRIDEVRNRLMSDVIIPPSLRQSHEQGMQHYLATGSGPILRQRIEINAMRRSGEEFPVEIAIVPFEAEGRTYFAGFLRDIAARKTLEAEQIRVNGLLKDSLRELEYQNFALDQHSIVSISDSTGDITYVNHKFTEISGYNRSELIGSNHRLIKSGLHPQSFYEALWKTISAGQVWHGQIANRRRTGEIYWVASTIVPWLGNDGLPYQYVSIRTDITAQKEVEQALEESRRRELETGNEIQRSLLFGHIPADIHGATLATYTEPSQGIDGDFFAVTRFRPDLFELLVGDVMGKGVPAALIGAAVKSGYNQVLAELLAQEGRDPGLPTPAAIINALHQHLTPRLIDLSTFVTLTMYRFDLAAKTVTLVNAGHTPGLLIHGGDGQIESILGNNLPIGILGEEIYEQFTIPMHPGDSLLVYSDGITEACDMNRNEFGLERLCHHLHAGRAAKLPPNVLLQSLRQGLRQFVGHNKLVDDQTAIMVELQPVREYSCNNIDECLSPETFILPWRLDHLTTFRQHVQTLVNHLPVTDADALVLACFEAATNILRHARPYFADATLTCRVTRDKDVVTVELLHLGDLFVPTGEPNPDFTGNSGGGFGLYIIQNCVDTVDYFSPLPGVSCVRLIKRARGEASHHQGENGMRHRDPSDGCGGQTIPGSV